MRTLGYLLRNSGGLWLVHALRMLVGELRPMHWDACWGVHKSHSAIDFLLCIKGYEGGISRKVC